MEPRSNMGLVCPECADERHKKWQEDNKHVIFRPGDIVKMAFDSPVKKRDEHMWVEITECSKDQKNFKGTLENDPVRAIQYENGDFLEFSRDEIEQHVLIQ